MQYRLFARTLTLLLLSIPALCLAQNYENPWGIGLGGTMLRYIAPAGADGFGPQQFQPAAQLSLSKYLAGGFDFRTQLTLAPNISYPSVDGRSWTSPLVDMNYLLAFKINNGVFLRESARIGPFLMAGIGGSYVDNNPDAYLPIGGGIRIRFNQRMSLNLQSMRKFSLNKDVQNIAHAIAFVYNIDPSEVNLEDLLPGEIDEEILVSALIPRDTDHDGLVDHEDRCPYDPGIIAYAGCPTEDTDAVMMAAVVIDSTSLTDDDPLLVVADAPETAESQESDPFIPEAVETPVAEPLVASVMDLRPQQTDKPVEASNEGFMVTPQPDTGAVVVSAHVKPPVPSALPPEADSDFMATPPQESTPTPITSETADPYASAVVARLEDLSPPRPETNSLVDFPCGTYDAKNVSLDPVFFDLGSDDLPAEAIAHLEQIATVMKSCGQTKLMLNGHADATGAEKDNLVLSIMRAFNVKYYLVYQHGINQQRIVSKGLGEYEPMAQNSTNNGRQQNRRVEFQLLF